MTHVIITGDVQGVGFRQYIRYKARKLNIKGWVKNLSDGSVEAVFQGDPKNIEKMMNAAYRGPLLARVDDVKSETWEDEAFSDFKILKA